MSLIQLCVEMIIMSRCCLFTASLTYSVNDASTMNVLWNEQKQGDQISIYHSSHCYVFTLDYTNRTNRVDCIIISVSSLYFVVLHKSSKCCLVALQLRCITVRVCWRTHFCSDLVNARCDLQRPNVFFSHFSFLKSTRNSIHNSF